MARRRPRLNTGHILSDIGLIALSVISSLILVKTGVLADVHAWLGEFTIVGTFVAGMFFTSVFTTAPAIASLGELSLTQSVFLTGLVGALGAVAGDMLIFRFVKDRVADDVIEVLRYEGVLRRARRILQLRFFRWFTLLLGGLVIASPLPDELGIALLGMSKVNVRYFLALSFTFNFLGIIAIGLAARALAGA